MLGRRSLTQILSGIVGRGWMGRCRARKSRINYFVMRLSHSVSSSTAPSKYTIPSSERVTTTTAGVLVNNQTTSNNETNSAACDTLINMAVNRDISGILDELRNMHRKDVAMDKESHYVDELDLGTLFAKLYFEEKVAISDVSSIEHCCDILDLLEQDHPSFVQQGYSKLLDLCMTGEKFEKIVCFLMNRIIERDIHLGNSTFEAVIHFLINNNHVEEAISFSHKIPLSREILLHLVEPLFLFGRHLEFAQLFEKCCTPLIMTIADVRWVIVSMIWAHGLRPPLSQEENENFVTAIIRSIDSYKCVIEAMADHDPNCNRASVNKIFHCINVSLRHVFRQANQHTDFDDTERIISDIRYRFATSRNFSPYPFIPQDCVFSSNFSRDIPDITAQLTECSSDTLKNPFLLSNSLWPQDYANNIRTLVGEGDSEEDYDEDSESDSDFDEDYSSEDESFSDEIEISSSSDDGCISDVDECDDDISEKNSRVDMISHLSRSREDNFTFGQGIREEDGLNSLEMIVKFFLINNRIHVLVSAPRETLSAKQIRNYSPQGAVSDLVTNLTVTDDYTVKDFVVADISGQLGEDQNFRFASDLFGDSRRLHDVDSPTKSLQVIRDEMN